jgi:hypothetical protein
MITFSLIAISPFLFINSLLVVSPPASGFALRATTGQFSRATEFTEKVYLLDRGPPVIILAQAKRAGLPIQQK